MLGVDILRDRPFRDYRLFAFASSGSGVEGRSVVADAATATTPQEFLSILRDPRRGRHHRDVRAAARARRRQRVTARASAIGERPFVVRGLLKDEGPARVLDGNFVLMDIAAAQ